MSVGDKLKELRQSHGYTQLKIADYLNIDQGLVSKIEHGERNLNVTLLDKLCDLYNCDEDYILGLSDEYSGRKIAFRVDGCDMDLNIVSRMNKIMNNLKLLRDLDDEV